MLIKFVDLNVWILKWHFAAYFIIRNWLLEKWRPAGMMFKILFGLVFVIHDLAVNWLLSFKFEPPIDELNLVTARMQRYKKLLPADGNINSLNSEELRRYLWAVEMCEFADKYDNDHC